MESLNRDVLGLILSFLPHDKRYLLVCKDWLAQKRYLGLNVDNLFKRIRVDGKTPPREALDRICHELIGNKEDSPRLYNDLLPRGVSDFGRELTKASELECYCWWQWDGAFDSCQDRWIPDERDLKVMLEILRAPHFDGGCLDNAVFSILRWMINWSKLWKPTLLTKVRRSLFR